MIHRCALITLLLLTACEHRTTPQKEADPHLTATTEETREYLRQLSSRLVARPLQPDELAAIDERGPEAIDPLVRAWLAEPAFQAAARDMIEHLLKTSGRHGDIDYDLPGNLAAHLVKHQLPYSMLLTANYCVGSDDQQIECDTTAPYNAGVLTTRAYLSSNTSRFNLRRASTLMRVFACRGYPMDADLQPPIDKGELISMFRALTVEEQEVDEVKSGFGNGLGCYTCHSQFAAHSQLFVKFDSTGLWRSFAHGLQNDYGELGRSIGRFYASHFADPKRSEDERGQVFGREVANLAEAARAVVEEKDFVTCAVRRAFEYAFDLDETVSAQTDDAVYRSIKDELARAGHRDPTFAELFHAVVTDPMIARAVIDQR